MQPRPEESGARSMAELYARALVAKGSPSSMRTRGKEKCTEKERKRMKESVHRAHNRRPRRSSTRWRKSVCVSVEEREREIAKEEGRLLAGIKRKRERGSGRDR